MKSLSCTLRTPSGTHTVDLPVPAVGRESVADIVFPDALGETIDMANYPITLSYLTLGLDMNTLGETYHMTIPAVEVIYNYYNENASGIESVANAGLAWTVEGRTVLLGRTADRIELYNVGGGLVALARESDPHIGSRRGPLCGACGKRRPICFAENMDNEIIWAKI